jgi:hypothetical protein
MILFIDDHPSAMVSGRSAERRRITPSRLWSVIRKWHRTGPGVIGWHGGHDIAGCTEERLMKVMELQGVVRGG